MAKNTKNSLYDIEKDNKSQVKKGKAKKNVNNKKTSKDSHDNEIIIGVTNITREHIEESKNKKRKNNVKRDNSIKRNNNIKKQVKKKDLKIQKKDKKNKKEVVEKVILDEEVFLEQRKEERKQKRIRNFRIAKILMIIIAIMVVILLIMFSPLFNIKEIEVRNNELISTEKILSLSDLRKDVNIFKISVGKISNRIKENIYIEDAEIIRELPSKIVINIKERKPSFIIEYANGYATIDRTGFILELNDAKTDLPILQGLETTSEKFLVGRKLEKGDLNKVYIVSKIMDIANNNDMKNLISRIDIENVKDIKIIIESKEKTAYVGDDSNLNIKLLTIKQMIEKTEGLAGEIFVNIDLNSEYPVFREKV